MPDKRNRDTRMQQQQQPSSRKSKLAYRPNNSPGSVASPPVPSYLRILFPRHIQLREPVPQLLSQPLPDLDAEAYHFLALLVRDFIQSWYSSISTDPQLITSIVNIIIDIARKLEQRCREVNWVGLLLQDVPDVLRRHYVDYRQATQKVETAYAPNQTIESIFHGLQPHFALHNGEESEKEYLRQLADELLRILLPKSEYDSDCVRWLVREILCCLVLRSLVEILTEPDMVNYIVNTLLVDFEPTDEKYEEFLKKAADKMDTSDDNFTAFLASLGRYKGGPPGGMTHRSSTPNIQTTDEMVTMLQDAQSSALGIYQQESKRSQTSFLRPERNDGLHPQCLANNLEINRVPSPFLDSSFRSASPIEPLSVSQYVPSLEPPLQIPMLTNKPILLRDRDTSRTLDRTTGNGGNRYIQAQQRRGRNTRSMTSSSRIRRTAIWAVTEAPPKYTKYMINNVLIPFGIFLAAFLNFMLSVPSKVNQISQSVVWIYAELEAPEQTNLEMSTIKLLKEIFYLEERNPVIWRQWEIMGWPLIRTFGGNIIDRLLAHGVYWIFAEPRLVMYIQAGRNALWPDPASSPPRPRGGDEVEKARKEAERRILRSVP
ncbi:hypothetical protein BX616_007199, partial [Lobosporangium transversale]